MTPPRRAFLALGFALLVIGVMPGPAEAQTPVEGGADFSSTPVLESGVMYADTARPGEQLYYGVDLAAGQKVVARVRIDGSGLDAAIYPDLEIYSPHREKDSFAAVDGHLEPGDRETLRLSGEFVGGDGVYASPGVYFIVLEMNTVGDVPRAELDLTVELEVRGDPVISPSPSESGAPSASPSATGAPESPGPGATDGGSDMPIYVVSFLLGAGLGAVTIRRAL